MSVDDDSGHDEPTPASPEQHANNSDDGEAQPPGRSVSWFDSKVGGFTLLLLDEFLTLHGLVKTASLLKRELQEHQIVFPSSQLWFDLYPSCHAAISQPSTASLTSMMERLVGFCLELPSQHRRRSLKTALDLQPVTVCASPKRLNSNELFALSVTKKAAMMSAPSALSLMEAHTQLMRSPIVRPSRRAVEQSETKSSETAELRVESSPSSGINPRAKISMSSSKKKKRRHPGTAASRSSVQTNTAEQPPPGTYGEPALVQAHDALMKRDLSSSRFLERELRRIRLEKISEPPRRLLQQTAMASASSKAESDSYLHALMLERYGFNKRQECALCQVSFLLSNLPHRVSFKCVLDVYEQWQFTPPDLATSAKYKPPLCYDAVQVCRMCAQIIEQYSTQRHQRPTVSEPLSSARRARSMSSLPSRGGDDKPAFCSDPYALPPLFGDDCYDCDDWSYTEDGGAWPDDSGGMRCAITTEFPAKAIVYAQQQSDSMPAMSAKEWNVISPERSLIRQTMEESLANAAAMTIMQQVPQH